MSRKAKRATSEAAALSSSAEDGYSSPEQPAWDAEDASSNAEDDFSNTEARSCDAEDRFSDAEDESSGAEDVFSSTEDGSSDTEDRFSSTEDEPSSVEKTVSGTEKSTLHPQEAGLMALWSSGATWSSGQIWGPSSPVAPTAQNNQTKRRPMKRQPFFPKQQGDQSEWHINFATKLPGYASILALSQSDVDKAVADNLILAYAVGEWIVSAREAPPSWTSSLDNLAYGTGSVNFAFPTLVVPPLPTLPAGITCVKPGALQRTFDLVQAIKRSPGYTEAIGLDLGIVGEEDSAEHNRPEFTLKTEAGDGCNCVKVRHKKFGHYAVAVYCKRGGGGWELLGISKDSPYMDERPLLVPGQPEVREYKLRFWGAGTESGDWTDVASITVSP